MVCLNKDSFGKGDGDMAVSMIGPMKVATLKAKFHEEFGLILRIYDGRSFADDTSTIAQIRTKNGAGELNIRKNMQVGNLENTIQEGFGIKTQIAGSDDSYLCDNDVTLEKALEEDITNMLQKANASSKDEESISESRVYKGDIENWDEWVDLYNEGYRAVLGNVSFKNGNLRSFKVGNVVAPTCVIGSFTC